jgi:hypothetical protein
MQRFREETMSWYVYHSEMAYSSSCLLMPSSSSASTHVCVPLNKYPCAWPSALCMTHSTSVCSGSMPSFRVVKSLVPGGTVRKGSESLKRDAQTQAKRDQIIIIRSWHESKCAVSLCKYANNVLES